MNRRNFLQSILALGIAPAIVRAESLMPIRLIKIATNQEIIDLLDERIKNAEAMMRAQLSEVLWNYASESESMELIAPSPAATPGHQILTAGNLRTRLSLSAPDAKGSGQRLRLKEISSPIQLLDSAQTTQMKSLTGSMASLAPFSSKKA